MELCEPGIEFVIRAGKRQITKVVSTEERVTLQLPLADQSPG
jgi:hypothetical protein